MENKWKARFLQLAQLASSWSKDVNNPVGAVISEENRMISLGYNGYASGVEDLNDPADLLEQKTLCAGENAILFAERDLSNCSMFMTELPSPNTAIKIIQTGISSLYLPEGIGDAVTPGIPAVELTYSMLNEANVAVYWIPLGEAVTTDFLLGDINPIGDNKWHHRFLAMSKLVASWSKDPSTQVGAVITEGNRVVSSGYNGYPNGIDDKIDPREIKYLKTIHAEENAILFAKRKLANHHIYVTHFPCSKCASKIVQTGIKKVHSPAMSQEFLSRWGESFKITEKILADAGVEVVWLTK